MTATQLPPVTHVLALTTIRRERQLPVPGTVTARVNEKVQAPDVIAEAEAVPRHLFLDLARGLGVPEDQAGRHVRRHVGDQLDAGDLIAGPVGLARRTVRAPARGRIVSLSGHRLLFEAATAALTLQAGFPALVVASDGTRSVTLETAGALIQAAWGNGRQDYGVMRSVGSGPGDRIQTAQLDINLRGAVLFGGICDQPAPLHQATELSVRGMILGSIPAELIPVALRLPYPLVVTEGFGRTPMNTAAFSLLTANVGHDAAVNAQPAEPYGSQRPEVIIPLPASRPPAMPEETVALAPKVRVRVLRAPYQGVVGVVRELPTRAVDYPSGILARSASVELEGIGTKLVPLANLEILQ